MFKGTPQSSSIVCYKMLLFVFRMISLAKIVMIKAGMIEEKTSCDCCAMQYNFKQGHIYFIL